MLILVNVKKKKKKREIAHLTCSAVGQTLFAIGCQVKVSGASALVAPSRREQTQVTAASVVRLAWVVSHLREKDMYTSRVRSRSHRDQDINKDLLVVIGDGCLGFTFRLAVWVIDVDVHWPV